MILANDVRVSEIGLQVCYLGFFEKLLVKYTVKNAKLNKRTGVAMTKVTSVVLGGSKKHTGKLGTSKRALY